MTWTGGWRKETTNAALPDLPPVSAQNSEGITVSALNRIISEGLRREPRLRNVTVTAEVSGFRHYPASGHWYFTLKDDAASISCVMFRQYTGRAAIRPRDGDQVTVRGSVEIFARDGRIQLYVTEMKAAGLGSLYERFEALKRKLEAEGLFDPGRKRVLPLLPRKVVLITSGSGAALHDMLNVSGHRSPGIPILLIPCTVQGAGAGRELAAAVQKVSRIPDVDAVIIGRGGGSVEDLWCFNDEALARAIAACPVPVVSGVGHETDFTICDYVADVRASTPSNAAEIVFPDRAELRGRVMLFRTGLTRAMNEQIHLRLLRLHEVRERLSRQSPENTLRRLKERSGRARQRLEEALRVRLRQKESQLTEQRTRLSFGMERLTTARAHDIQRMRARLEAISPLRVLERGYALVYDGEGRILPGAGEARTRREMRIRFRDGTVDVERKEREPHGEAQL